MSWLKIKKPTVCVCGRSDWCLVSDKGTAFLCMRSQSERPHKMKDGSIGYIHFIGDSVPVQHLREEPRRKEFSDAYYRSLVTETKPAWQDALARELGVTSTSIAMLGAAWSPAKNAWAFPMRDGYGNIIGIRMRSDNGRKWAISGSHNGVFMPMDWKGFAGGDLWICEGPTDLCAGYSIGLNIVGRPSCSAGSHDIVNLIRSLAIPKVCIIADNDKDGQHGERPGIDGAHSLVKVLGVPARILTLPTKDLRLFVQLGGTRRMLDVLAGSMPWHRVFSFSNGVGRTAQIASRWSASGP